MLKIRVNVPTKHIANRQTRKLLDAWLENSGRADIGHYHFTRRLFHRITSRRDASAQQAKSHDYHSPPT
jgi:hypothetical protein